MFYMLFNIELDVENTSTLCCIHRGWKGRVMCWSENQDPKNLENTGKCNMPYGFEPDEVFTFD